MSIFNAQRVEYLLVGAYALAVHGLLRATGDIDLWVRRSEENSQRIMRSLADFGAPRSELSAEDLETPDLVFQIGLVPRRIDILTSITGVGFEEAWEEREEVEVEGMMIPVISRRHLIVNKRSVGRLKDLADANWLEGKIE